MSQQDFGVLLGELKGKLDSLLTMVAGHDKRADEHEKRINKLEQWRAWVVGVSSAIGAASSWLASLLHDGLSKGGN